MCSEDFISDHSDLKFNRFPTWKPVEIVDNDNDDDDDSDYMQL